jgi:hypothetical protein
VHMDFHHIAKRSPVRLENGDNVIPPTPAVILAAPQELSHGNSRIVGK